MPVWRDEKNDLEDWAEIDTENLPSFYSPFTVQAHPSTIFRIRKFPGFELVESKSGPEINNSGGKIPRVVFDKMDAWLKKKAASRVGCSSVVGGPPAQHHVASRTKLPTHVTPAAGSKTGRRPTLESSAENGTGRPLRPVVSDEAKSERRPKKRQRVEQEPAVRGMSTVGLFSRCRGWHPAFRART